jgi:hypothetical protein
MAAEATQITASETDKAQPRLVSGWVQVAYVGAVPEPSASLKPAVLGHNVAVWTANPDGTDEKAFTDLALDAWLIGWCAPAPGWGSLEAE